MTNPTGLPYTPARRAGDWIIVSGQVGLAGGSIVGGGFHAEMEQALANLRDRLAEHGAGMADVPRPARSAVGVAELPLGALVEIEAWALAPAGSSAPG
jgi:2-iminobutanoate/2-iminopropanoate deaminase